MTQEEIWKPIKGYEDSYEVSNKGRVRTVDRIINVGKYRRHVKSSIRALLTNEDGYLYVRLINKKGQRKRVLIHRALMEAFVPNPENKPYIDHINTIKTDNNLENLRWVTPKENTNNPITLEHIKEKCSSIECKNKQRETKERHKVANYNPCRVFQYSLDGVFLMEYPSISEAVRSLGLTHRQSVSNIKIAIDNDNRSAYGYLWTSKRVKTVKYKKVNGKSKSVQQIDEYGNVIRSWLTVSDAASEIGVFDSNLSRHIKHNGGRYKDMLFRYGD